jgi:tetratricopeptide (TPR) repeat protein
MQERATPPSTFNTYLIFVDQFMENKQYKRAIKMCQKALKLAPDSQKAKELLALANALQASKMLASN